MVEASEQKEKEQVWRIEPGLLPPDGEQEARRKQQGASGGLGSARTATEEEPSKPGLY